MGKANWAALSGAMLMLSACGGTPPPAEDAGGSDANVGAPCATDLDCDDGIFCNGVERCAPGTAGADAVGCARGSDPCLAGQRCDEAMDLCASNCSVIADADGDGSDAIACGGADCDDTNPNRHPGATEVCDAASVDEDCDDTTFGARDGDGDGFVDATCCNDLGAGGMRCGDDCSDYRRDVHPGLPETCDFLDNDCDGSVDETAAVAGFADLDHDLHGDPSSPLTACPDTPGFSVVDDDCNDHDPEVHASQLEICDGKDNNCNGDVDEAPAAVTWYADDDDDGFGVDGSRTVVSCTPVPSFSLRPSDCDDMRRDRNPAARELCNGEDDDCDGVADFMIAAGNLEDDDGDGFADHACGGDDCNDSSPAVHPGALELCDGIDNDCDGIADGATAMALWYLDLDGDGYGDEGMPAIESCTPQPARVPRGGDCDDSDASIRPGAGDHCDGFDGDCDGATDEDSPRFAYYVDLDGDGWGLSAGSIVFACLPMVGRATRPGDCDDGSVDRYPGAPELCDLVDDDCDSRVDEDAPTNWYPDVDRDGHGVPAGAILTCAPPSGYAAVSDDCDDSNPARYAGHAEDCDLLDNDCNGTVDDGASAACGVAHGMGTCASGTCGIASCATGYADCDARFDTGCEVDTSRTATHCGSCAMSCALGDTCGRVTAGVCDMATITRMIAGDSHTLTLLSTGTLLGWGANGSGRVGSGGTTNVPVPTPVMDGVLSYSAGESHSCAVSAAHRGFCWGDNSYGKLGDGTGIARSTAAPVQMLPPVVQIAAGSDHTCALGDDGTVYCWGRRAAGQVGDGVVSATQVMVPTPVVGIDDAVEIVVGLDHSCARRPLGGGGYRVQCWGSNGFGQLGNGTFSGSSGTPGDVMGLPSDIVGFLQGVSDHTCVRLSTGGVRCWGASAFGGLGDGDTSRENPTGVVVMTDVSAAEATDVVGGCSGWFLTCVLRDRGPASAGYEVWCAGADDVGQLGNGPTQTSPIGRLGQVLGDGGIGVFDDAIAVSCGRRFACAAHASGHVSCWGTDEVENLGDGTGISPSRDSPRPTLGL